MIRSLFLSFSLLTALVTHSVQGHSVWIEPLENGQMGLRFAEPDMKLETSPGYLDALSLPVGFTLSNTTPVSVESSKKSDHFLLQGTSSNQVTCAETGFIVMTERGKNTPGKPGRKPFFYARWQPVGTEAGTPALTLDIVPTGKPGKARAYFRGKPLGNVKATLRLPDETEKEITVDAEGFLHFKEEQSGQYMLTIAHHRETIPGFYGGWPYELTSHNASLSWRKP